MTDVVAIAGSSGAGKTMLVERLVPALSALGLRVGYLKHAHAGFEVDRPGSDSARALAAGATQTAVTGGGAFVLDPGAGTDPTRCLAWMSDCDLVLAEGFSTSPWPKIVVRGHADTGREVREPIIAEIVTDSERRASDDDVARVVEAILALEPTSPRDVSLVVDGRTIPLEGFAARIVAETVVGMVSALKGVDGATSVTLAVHGERSATTPKQTETRDLRP